MTDGSITAPFVALAKTISVIADQGGPSAARNGCRRTHHVRCQRRVPIDAGTHQGVFPRDEGRRPALFSARSKRRRWPLFHRCQGFVELRTVPQAGVTVLLTVITAAVGVLERSEGGAAALIPTAHDRG
jgi:hypothetical protein